MNLHEIKVQYVSDIFKLCGYSITSTHIATGLHPKTLKVYLEIAGIDHKTPVVKAAAVVCDTWRYTEHGCIMSTYRRFEYDRVKTSIELGLSPNGLGTRMKQLGILSPPVKASPIQLFASASNHPDIHSWFNACPEMVQAACRNRVIEEIKRELNW